MADKCVKVANKSLNYIFDDNELLICLVCKINLKENLSFDHNVLLESNHLNSKKHQKNVRALFKLCVPNWSGSYAEIIQSLVFDVSLERNESSFVCKTDNNFVCLVCQETVARGTDSNEIVTSIIRHLKTDFHLINFKDGVSWIHPVDHEVAFIMFHKSAVHCSICKQNVPNEITCPLTRAMDHLKVHHSVVYKILYQQQNKDSCTNEKSVCQAMEYLALTDMASPSTKSISSDRDTELSPSTKSSLSSRDTELSLDSFEFEADEFEDLVGSFEFEDHEFENLLRSDVNEESLNESIDICVDLICPECGDYIEIYNENADFSMDLHLQKHKTLMSANTESGLDYQDDADYVCPICQETIQIFNGNLELSVDRHFEEEGHEHERFTLADCGDKNRFDFLSRVFDQLPHDVRDQKSVFVMDGNEVFCKLCSCTVSSSKHVPDACKVFSDHMSSTFHVDQFKASSQFLVMAVLNYNQQSFPQEDAKEQDNVFKNLCKQHLIIERNKQFIEKRKINYYCIVCDKHICHSPKENTQVLNFVLHLNGGIHKQSLKQLGKKKKIYKNPVDYSSNSQKEVVSKKEAEVNNSILELSKQYPAVYVNQSFIKEKDGNFFCEICQVMINFNKTGCNLKKHCASPVHNTELSARGLLYLSQLQYEKLTNKYKSALSKLTKYPYFKPHTLFINHNGEDFCCIICNMPIAGSKSTGKNVQRHFFTLKHRRTCFEVTCNPDYNPTQLKSQNITVPSLSTNTKKKSINTTTEMSVAEKRANKKLNYLLRYSSVLRNNVHFIETRNNGNYFCNLCEEHILCNSSGSHLKEHYLKEIH